MAQTSTREEETLVQGGLLTHVVSSALLGAADLDGDGRVTYGELTAYLEFYSSRYELVERFRVQTPREAPERPPMLMDLATLGATGLELASSSAVVERYWIVDEVSGRLVAELCKRGQDMRRIHLPAGRYRVQRFAPTDAWFGQEETFTVRDGFSRVNGEALKGWWVWGAGKGPKDVNVPSGARQLSRSEASYHALSPFRQAVPWPSARERTQWMIRLGMVLPMLGPGLNLDPEARAGALFMDQPSEQLMLVVDHRARSLRGLFLRSGIEAMGSVSTGNRVGYSTDAGAYSVGLGIRLGLEHPRDPSAWAENMVMGVRFASPFATSNDSQQSSSLDGFGTMNVGYGGLELAYAHSMRQRGRLELGVRLELVLEPYRIGPDMSWEVTPYGGVTAFVGIGR